MEWGGVMWKGLEVQIGGAVLAALKVLSSAGRNEDQSPATTSGWI